MVTASIRDTRILGINLGICGLFDDTVSALKKKATPLQA
jgi:hypothetical protein